MNNSELKEKLEAHYITYKQKFSSKDPVWILHRFTDEKDIELVALITAAYAYGSVDQINMFINALLQKTGNKPYEFTINFSKRKDKNHLSGLYYRFNSHIDLLDMFSTLNKALLKFGSLKNLFLSHYQPSHKNIIPALSGFTDELNKNIRSSESSYYHYLFSNPVNKSACKRMNLFLRWMVRKDEIDTGLWKGIKTSKLVMPVDTHIAWISKKMKLVTRKTIDLKFALELTDKLKEFDPVDPVKYDFALCHIGIDKKEF
ncbi:MAG: TIGR02757 family protein [Ignavibacteria bacterium]|nr:TIGR02757 family protein [Ignavibacteria bacterium]